MLEMDSISESGDQPWIRLEPLKNTHLPGKATQSSEVLVDSSPKMTANGVHDIEDRILRITGYYGYKPGYSSHRSLALFLRIVNCTLQQGTCHR